MPIDKQQQYPAKPRIYDVLANAAQNYSTKRHADRGLPQICEVGDDDIYDLPVVATETNITPGQVEEFVFDYDNDPENTFARVWVTDADVTRHLQRQQDSNPELFAWAIELEGEDEYRQRLKSQLQILSIKIAMENMFGGYEPDPTDKHYQLWKEHHRLTFLAVEDIRDEACADQLLSEDDDDAISFNTKIIEQYEALKGRDRKFESKLQARLSMAEIAARRASTATMIRASHRPPHRARRATAGHGAATKAGDDGDGGDGGEPPRPQSFRSPTPSLHHSLAHSLTTAGGAQ